MADHPNDPRIIVALDFADPGEALTLAAQLDPKRCRLKVGKELFTLSGPALIRRLTGIGFDVFLDLKYHDIPNTVAGACAAAADLGCWMVNVHASGGRAMMAAARERVEACEQRPLLIAVTVLTSLTEADLREIGFSAPPREIVLRLAMLAREAGMDGVVCSAEEVVDLRRHLPPDFRLVTPGIRPAGAEHGDQKRVATPAAAVRDGADYLVIGRPITKASDPLQAIADIEAELAGVPA